MDCPSSIYYNCVFLMLPLHFPAVGEPINTEAWEWYHRVVGDGRCPIVDTWWQTGECLATTSPPQKRLYSKFTAGPRNSHVCSFQTHRLSALLHRSKSNRVMQHCVTCCDVHSAGVHTQLHNSLWISKNTDVFL